MLASGSACRGNRYGVTACMFELLVHEVHLSDDVRRLSGAG